MPTSEATQEQDLRLLLVLEWAEMELFSGNPDNALKVVLLAASPLLSGTLKSVACTEYPLIHSLNQLIRVTCHPNLPRQQY
jgi:hypothetical protein